MFSKYLEKYELKKTENGANAFNTSGSALVDLNFRVPSMRTHIDYTLFEKSLQEDTEHTLKWLLYLRDIKAGIGERKSFRNLCVYLSNKHEELFMKFLMAHIENFGRFDDYVVVAKNTTSEKIKRAIINMIINQLEEDAENMNNHKPISLLGKWMPSENSSSKETKALAKFMMKEMDMTPKVYRKLLSKFRKYIDVVETHMSSNDWDSIDYTHVPSKANLVYSNAFYNHDEERRTQYLKDLKEGKTKINANSMFLYDIIHKYRGHDSFYCYNRGLKKDDTLEELWRAQDKVEGFTDTLVVRDGSGSMTSYISNNSSVSAMDVGDAITIYATENNVGEYKNKFITFSSKLQFVDFAGCTSLVDKLNKLFDYNDCTNTNIEAVFDMVLNTAIKHKCTQEELPKQILIVSDLEWDDIANDRYCYYREESTSKVNKTLFEELSDRFKQSGYKMPKLVFWNVNSRTNTVPLQQNELGVILVSGFSKNIFDMVLSTELDPYKALIKELDSGRYDIIEEVLK